MARISAVEKTTVYATTVDSVTSAFEFVMAYLDEMGSAPEITIRPFQCYCDEPDHPVQGFEVSVSAMKEQE
jgi:hypothetical protein